MNEEDKSIEERVFDYLCEIAKVEDQEAIRKEMMETIEKDVKKYQKNYSEGETS